MSKVLARIAAVVALPAWLVAFLVGALYLAAFAAEYGDSFLATAIFILVATCTGMSSLLIIPVLLTGNLSSSAKVRLGQAISLALVNSLHLWLITVATLELLQYGRTGSTATVSAGLLLLSGVVVVRALPLILRLLTRRSSTEPIDQAA